MREMFTTIAPKYDFITRAFSFGMDRGWKRKAVAFANLPTGARILDLACGTGDFAKLVAEQCPGARIVAADLTELMLRRAGIPDCACADAVCLPFDHNSFDAVFIGYGLRNFPRLEAALAEALRVLKPGGVLVSLDFFLPNGVPLRNLYLGYLYTQGACWGILLHGRARVYTYIPDSLRSFLTAGAFSSLLERMAFTGVRIRRYLLGGIAVHRATKSGFSNKPPEAR
jgi:demethylmenaquinone methyltransferase/2-methoxy-6-polyprenyl-1,4-benzoquinol methylase